MSYTEYKISFDTNERFAIYIPNQQMVDETMEAFKRFLETSVGVFRKGVRIGKI